MKKQSEACLPFMGRWFLKSLDPDDQLYGQNDLQIRWALDYSAIALLEHASSQSNIQELKHRLDSFKHYFGQPNDAIYRPCWDIALERLLRRPWSYLPEGLGSAEPCVEVKELLNAYFACHTPCPTHLERHPRLKDYFDRHH